ncbi:hypothetical protein FRC08_001279, partial [Ceratobasidium sp. 394]
ERAAQLNPPPNAPTPPEDPPSPPPQGSPSDGPSAMSEVFVPPSTPFLNSHSPPPLELVKCAIPVLEARVDPRRKSGVGHKKSKLNPLALKDLTSVLELFRTYANTEPRMTWRNASIKISHAKGKGKGHAETLRKWGRACLLDPLYIPRTAYGHSQDPLIAYDEFQAELLEFLRGVGKYITAVSVIQYTAQPDTQSKWGLTEPISKTTAQKWMKVLGYRWGRQPKGLYLDGHECCDPPREDPIFLLFFAGFIRSHPVTSQVT